MIFLCHIYHPFCNGHGVMIMTKKVHDNDHYLNIFCNGIKVGFLGFFCCLQPKLMLFGDHRASQTVRVAVHHTSIASQEAATEWCDSLHHAAASFTHFVTALFYCLPIFPCHPHLSPLNYLIVSSIILFHVFNFSILFTVVHHH